MKLYTSSLFFTTKCLFFLSVQFLLSKIHLQYWKNPLSFCIINNFYSHIMQANHVITIETLSKRYMIEYAPGKKRSSYKEDHRLWDSYILPALGAENVLSLTSDKIKALHHSLQEKPTTANRVLSLLSKALNLAAAWGYHPLSSNPCRHIKKFPETKRHRMLSQDELSSLITTLDEHATQMEKSLNAVCAIKLLIFTGCYLNEILALKWQNVDLKNNHLHLPGRSSRRERVLLLSLVAVDLLRSMFHAKNYNQEYVIPGKKDHTHFVNLQKSWKTIREKAGLHDVRLHDLRLVQAQHDQL